MTFIFHILNRKDLIGISLDNGFYKPKIIDQGKTANERYGRISAILK